MGCGVTRTQVLVGRSGRTRRRSRLGAVDDDAVAVHAAHVDAAGGDEERAARLAGAAVLPVVGALVVVAGADEHPVAGPGRIDGRLDVGERAGTASVAADEQDPRLMTPVGLRRARRSQHSGRRHHDGHDDPPAHATHAAPSRGRTVGRTVPVVPLPTTKNAQNDDAFDPRRKAECHSRENFRPHRWYFRSRVGRVEGVIRAHGAPSIAQGRTPHEVQDELCRDAGIGCV